MARLQNDKHELYCYHRAKGMIPKKAQVAAGYAQGSNTHAQLEEDQEIQARILELTHEVQLKREQQRAAAMEVAKTVGQITGVTKAWVIQRLAENATAAKEEGDFKESNNALELIGKEYGMFNGASAIKDHDDEDGRGQVIDMDQASGFLTSAEGAMTGDPEADERPPVDMAMVERLIQGNKPVRAKDRQMKTGSETDVAMTPDAMTDDEV